MSVNMLGNIDEKNVVANLDDLPYFPESFPGKICCLCNLGERSGLGQGTMLQLKVPADFKDRKPNDTERDQGILRKIKSGLKSKGGNGDNAYELDKIGYADVISTSLIFDDEFVYAHRMCAMWTVRKSQVNESEVLQFLNQLSEYLEQKCSFCGQYGASITCKMNCQQVHHWPCAAAAGCFLILESFTVFCTEHLSQVPLICNDNNVECLSCSSLGDLSKLIMCCSCGDHFHSNCIGLANLPDTRSGWSCARCTKCQICRQQEANDIKFIKCEQCQKIYHATCLRPAISSIPKYGWKCNRCRVCTDCGSRTPGGGSSSRWHSHYTICDSCYQQRNKGFSCPICQKAYRAAAYKEMVKCSCCHKFVHSTCDEEADLTAYHKTKEYNPDYDYVCPVCKANSSGANKILDTLERPLNDMQASEQFNIKHVELEQLNGKPCLEVNSEDPLKLPSTKKKVCLTNIRGKGGKFVLHRMGAMSQLGKKRSTRGKGRQLASLGSGDRFIGRNLDTDPSSDKKLLLCSARDKFVLSQDICVMCGTLGIESDSVLITCAQCGQCYHPYCAGVKPSRGILKKGWRCLDCTVCEGCGKKNDEARLLLCDECDISYHTYCVNPPLETVPHGNWKCSFCTLCQKCGRNPTEKINFNEPSNPECPPCSSQNSCCVCKKPYADGEMLIQCEQCEQWSHFLCDSINSQHSTDYYDNNVYKCVKCRANAKPHLPNNVANVNDDTLAASKQMPEVGQDGKLVALADRNIRLPNELLESTEAIHWIDGVCLSESGLNMIKSLSTEIKRKRKMRQALANSKDAQGEPVPEEVPGDKFKDGMIWDKPEAALPEGFTISTNDDGVQILRKKRQRNLQKLGIGGFSVRNRALKKDNEDTIDQLNAMLVADKKKKIIRKKQKNKLIEAYPAYLQEAFFGKPLLESGEVAVYESDSSDEIGSSMKMYFTSNEKVQDSAIANKSPVKTVKNIKAEKNLNENKNNFGNQFAATPVQQTKKQLISAVSMDSPMPDAPTNISPSNMNAMDPLAGQVISELDEIHASINFMGSNDNTKTVMSEQAVLVDNYSVPAQLVHDQKFQSKIVVPQNVVAKPPQLQYQQKAQTIVTQIPMQNEKRVEETKPPEAVESINVGTQKTAEKMRKDEELGLMATISAVLYANTEHPNLKDMYPNWTDRCKQILKMWRSLCNEKKAPFLQKAKDNRSALRQRREQGKVSQPAKLEKQDDQRAWKQQQPCKPKEDQNNLFDGVPYEAPCYIGSAIQPASMHQPMMISNENLVIKPPLQRTAMHPTPSSSKMSPMDNQMDHSTTYDPEPVGDKKLRNLLQKNNSDAVLMNSGSEFFLQNDVLRLGLIQNSGLTQNNPMLSMSGNPQHTEMRGLDHDTKAQLDIKMTESQEGISSSAVELENVGFSDILGGFGEGDDDDLLKSLTSEIGDDFNILEYADPELDVTLNTLDFDDTEKNSA